MSTQQILPGGMAADTKFGTEYGAYYKQFDWLGKIREGFWTRDVDSASRLLRENKRDVEIIGVQSASVKYKAFDSTFVNKTDLTAAIDATSKAGKVKISITNGSGATRFLSDLAVRGKAVKRISGKQGFIHDSFQDKRSIRLNGRIPLEVGNNFLQSRDHIRKVADWLWKLNGSEKSIYTYDIEGCRQHYQPGKWYSLSWTAGIEIISVTVKCLSVQTEISSAYGNRTIVEWGEVEQNWTFDSSYLTKFIVGGTLPQDFDGPAVIVGATDYTGTEAHYICDGTNDEVEINLAIQWVKGSYGGGHVLLTEGTFVIGAAIEMLSGVTLLGRGDGTVLDRNCNDYTIEAVGGSGTEKTGVGIQNMKLTFTDTNVIQAIYFNYSDSSCIRDVTIYDPKEAGISVENSDGVIIQGCELDGGGTEYADVATRYYIALATVTDCLVTENRIHNIAGLMEGGAQTILGVYLSSSSANNIVSNNIISDIRLLFSGGFAQAITTAGNASAGCSIFNNKIANMTGYVRGIVAGSDFSEIRSNSILDVSGIGIYIEPGSDQSQVTANLCKANGQLIDHADCETAAAPHITADGASSTNATLTLQDATQAHTGTYAVKHAITATGSESIMRMVDNTTTTDMHTLSAGKTYVGTAWVYVPSAGGPTAAETKLRIAFYAGSWQITDVAATVQDAWEQLSVEVTMTSATGTTFAGVIAAAASNGELVYWDDIRLYEKGVANTHSMNYDDDGTSTNASGNSWQ